MSRLQVPLESQLLWHTQETAVRAFLDLELRDSSGNWHAQHFRVQYAQALLIVGSEGLAYALFAVSLMVSLDSLALRLVHLEHLSA